MKIYIIQAQTESGPVFKIGVTNNHLRRISMLATGCPYPLVFVGIVDHGNPRVIEKSLHRALAKYRIRGEWFRCSKSKILKAITDCGATFAPVEKKEIVRSDYGDSFADSLRFHADRLQLTQAQMADILEVSPRCIFSWLTSKAMPLAVTKEGVLLRLAAAQ